MTPAQRQYDLDLARSMQRMAEQVAPRSQRVASALTLGAQRIVALHSPQPEPLPPDDMRDGDLPKQPASTPARRKRRAR